jgi:heparan-alpha-glucosaminide N-acetyltransferase
MATPQPSPPVAAGKRPVAASEQSLAVGERIVSMDVLRGLTMLLMLWVNDIGHAGLEHVKGVSQSLLHMPVEINGMTMPDVIWPTFMLLVGMSIPLSLEGRFARGDSWLRVLGHVGARAAALIFIGVCMVNAWGEGRYDAKAAGMSGPVWGLLMFLGAILLWNAYPRTEGFWKWFFVVLRVAGAALLVYLLVIYRATDDTGHTIWMRPGWWGIIGQIGWAYLIAALVWLACRDHGAAVMGAFALLMALTIGAQYAWLDEWWNHYIYGYTPHLREIAWQSAAAVAGMVIATLFRPNSGDCPNSRAGENGTVPFKSTPYGRIAWMLVFAAGLAVAAWLFSPFWGIHKKAQSPSWILYSLAIATVVYVFLYWLIDVKQIRRWTALVTPAGSNTLLMYCLPHIFYMLLALAGITYLDTHFYDNWPRVARSGVLALFFFAVASLLTRCRIRLRV